MDGSEYKIAWSDFEHWSEATMAQQGERHGWQRIKKPTALGGQEAATPIS